MSLASKRLNTLSEISRDIGQVFLATLLIGPVMAGRIDEALISFGATMTILFWVASIILTR